MVCDSRQTPRAGSGLAQGGEGAPPHPLPIPRCVTARWLRHLPRQRGAARGSPRGRWRLSQPRWRWAHGSRPCVCVCVCGVFLCPLPPSSSSQRCHLRPRPPCRGSGGTGTLRVASLGTPGGDTVWPPPRFGMSWVPGHCRCPHSSRVSTGRASGRGQELLAQVTTWGTTGDNRGQGQEGTGEPGGERSSPARGGGTPGWGRDGIGAPGGDVGNLERWWHLECSWTRGDQGTLG